MSGPSAPSPASGASYALERLDTGDRPVALAGVGDEILAVARLLEQQPRLRRALSDPARAGRSALSCSGPRGTARFGRGRRGAAARAGGRPLVVGRRAADAVERLGVEAVLASAEAAGELADVEDELFRFGQIVDGDTELAAALGRLHRAAGRAAGWRRACSAGKARPATIRLVDLALRGFGGRNFAAGLPAWSSWRPTGGNGRSPT